MSNIVDALVTAIFFAVFAFAAIISLFVFNSINSTGMFGSQTATYTKFYEAINNVGIFIALGMSLAAVVSAMLIRSHPVFFAIAIILVFVEFLVIPPIVNAYNSVVSGSFSTEAASLSNIVNIMQYLPIITAVTTFLAAAVGIMRE